MDFDASFTEGLGFIYVLPTTKNKALVEYTVFSKNILLPHQLEVYFKPALTKYFKETQYKTLRTEYGRLPMGYQKTRISNDPNYVYAGLFAGGARPSSGYAFQRIQSWAKSCASALLSNQSLVAPKKDTAILSIMDAIFLNVLKSNPRSSIFVFYTFFSNCKTNTIIRFLSDHANLRDYLSIVIAMPTLIFLKELPSYVFKRIVRRNHDPIS
jgi:lycopene beta-cyclase